MTENPTPEPKKKLITPRGVVRFMVGNVTHYVVAAAITTLVPAESKTDKVRLAVGAYIVGEMVAAKARDYISHEIDEILETVREVKASVKETPTDSPNP